MDFPRFDESIVDIKYDGSYMQHLANNVCLCAVVTYCQHTGTLCRYDVGGKEFKGKCRQLLCRNLRWSKSTTAHKSSRNRASRGRISHP
jgi:hypothetical protein